MCISEHWHAIGIADREFRPSLGSSEQGTGSAGTRFRAGSLSL